MEDEQQDVGDSGEDGRSTLGRLHQGHHVPGHVQGSPAAGAGALAPVVTHSSDLQARQQQQQQQHTLQHDQSQAGQAAQAPDVAPLTALHLQQLQQQSSWAAAWRDQPLNSSSGSGSSLGGLLGQISAAFPAAPGQLLVSETAAIGAWQGEQPLGGSAGPGELEVQGRRGHAAPVQQLPRQPATSNSGVTPSGLQYQSMSLPASPTMLQHQRQQLFQQTRHQHSISPSTGTWPDIEMEQPLAAAAAAAAGSNGGGNNGESGDNGDSLLWPGGPLIPPSSSPNLLQPGVPLGMRLRSMAATSPEHQQHQHQQQQRSEFTIEEQPNIRQTALHPGHAGSQAAVTAGVQQFNTPWSSGRATPEQLLQDQQLMPPPPPPQAGGGLETTRSAPRPPPLIIPSTQPQQLQQQMQQPQQLLPTPSSAPPTTGTSVTPGLFSMALAETPIGGSDIAAAVGMAHADPGSSGGGGSRARRARRRTSVPSFPAAASGGVAGLLNAGRRYIQVVCGGTSGWLDVVDMLIQVQGPEQEEGRVTPSAFEALAGKSSTRKWRQSLIVMPLGQDDQLVPEPIALGDFMKQHQLDRPPSAAGQLGRVSSSSVAAVEEGAFSAMQHPSLVSPGVRRRRQSYTLSQESQEPAAADPAESGNLRIEHVKRSRGAAGWTMQQQQQQQQQQLTWHHPATPGSMSGAESIVSHNQQQQQQHGKLSPMQSDVWQSTAAAAGGGGGITAADASQGAEARQQQWMYSAEDVHPAAATRAAVQPELVQQQQLERTVSTQLQQHAHPMRPIWRPYSPQPLEYTAEQPAHVASVAGAAREHHAVSQPQQQRRRHQQASALSDQAEVPRSLQKLQQSGQPTAADVPSKAPEAAGQVLLSPSGRPIRQPASSRRASLTAPTSSAARYERGSQPVGFKGGIQHLQVWCDQLPGMLDLYKMQVVPQEGQCEGQPMSLSAFEQLGGRGTARKWRRSLSVIDNNEVISLGEWLERYQISAGAEKHVSPRVAPKPRGTTPPAATGAGAGRSSRQGTHATTYGWQSRDQQGRKPAQQQQQQQQQYTLPQGTAVEPFPVDDFQLQRSDKGTVAVPNRAVLGSSAGQMGGQSVGRPGQGERPPGCYLQLPQNLPAAAAGPAAAGEPVNQELLMMLREYANEYVNLELGLHPAQVEQDLADVTAPTAGSAGVMSSRLMDWQQHYQQPAEQQQQQQYQQQYHGSRQHPSAGLHPAAAGPAPPSLLQIVEMLPGPGHQAAGATMLRQQQHQQQLTASTERQPQQQQSPLHAVAGQAQTGFPQQLAGTPFMSPVHQYAVDSQALLGAAAAVSAAAPAAPAAAEPEASTYTGGYVPQQHPGASNPTDAGQRSTQPPP